MPPPACDKHGTPKVHDRWAWYCPACNEERKARFRLGTLCLALFLLFGSCGNAPAGPTDPTDIVEFMPFVLVANNPIVTHDDGTYPNLAPAGWVVDPDNTARFILYVTKYDASNNIVGAIISAYGAPRDNPSALALVQDNVIPFGNGSGAGASMGGVDTCNGIIYYYYTTATAASPDNNSIRLATSTDGRTFTDNGLILEKIAGETQVLYPSPLFTNQTTCDGYLYFTGPVDPGGATDNIVIAALSNGGKTATRTNVAAWTKGSGADPDGYMVEGGQAYRVGSQYASLYPGYSNSEIWTVNFATSDDPNAVFVKRGAVTFSGGNASWVPYGKASPTFVIDGDLTYLFFQGTTQVQAIPTHWDIGLAMLPFGTIGSTGSFTGGMQ